MPEKQDTSDAMRRRAFQTALAPLIAAGRGRKRRREPRSKRRFTLRRLLGRPAESSSTTPDPVRIAIIAINTVGRASVRAGWTGKTVEVAAADEQTAEILRAALAETAKSRPTDRLIQVHAL
ncbi:MAG: hypothetical protein JO038_00800 [Alphaproteobacteria bacterium]|nr:hypothetical protein [Alphaproteobacteria bacterium]